MKTLFKKSLLVLMVMFIAVISLGVTSKVKAADVVAATFEFGANGSASHVDGSSLGSSKSYTANDYTLALTSLSSVYGPAYDAKGNSCIKLGTSKLVGSFNFTVPEDVTSVVIAVAKYKANTTKIKVNNVSYTISGSSNDGAYDNITVDTSSTKTVSFTTVSGGVRCMINTITFYKAEVVVDPSEHECELCSICNKCTIAGCPENEQCPTHSLSINGGNYTEVEDVITLTASLTNLTGDVVWTSSNQEVASVDQSGNVTALAIGTTTITATLGDFKATQQFTVYPTDGSILTVAEAITVCKLSGETNSPYKYSLTANITSIDDVYSEQYGNISVTVSDETGSIKVFRLTGGSELLVGDNITVTGYLVNYYGNTPEFAAGCTYVKHVNESIETIKTALNEIKAYMSLAYKYSVVEPVEGASQVVLADQEVISFDLGANGSASHYDGSEISAGKSYTSGNYTLKVDKCSKVYDGARDAKGNSCLKFGTSSVVGSLQFTVPEEVTSVVIYAAKYKSNTTKVSLNGTTYTLTQNSNDGKYDELTVDTSSNKTVTLATVSGGVRCMINQIDYVIESQDPESPTIEYSSEFRMKCGVDGAIKNIASLAEGKEFSWGIEVSDGMTDPRYYASNSEYMLYDDNSEMQYVIINLGDVLNNIARAEKEFTVRAYVEVDGIKYYSSEAKTYSVASIVDVYCGFENLSEEQKVQVNSLNDVLTSLGC